MGATTLTDDAGRTLTNDGRRTLTKDARRTILFIGTSLTAGYGLDPDSAYPQQIQRMIDSAGLAYSVVNAGVSGETSSGLLRRVDWLLRQSFDLVVIETGANDGLRGIPIETMQDNIQRIIRRIGSERPNARIVLVQMEAPPNLGIGYTRRFRSVFPDLAKQTGVELIPFLLEDVAGRRELNQADGIHPNYEGERIVARNVWKGLRPILQ
jgi:acyl-CoA thioesterase-1